MMKSMTAFASAAYTGESLSVAIEIRTYNSRHLDIVLRLPGPYALWEEKIKSMIAATVARGRAEVRLSIDDTSPAADAFDVNVPRAQAYHRALQELAAQLQAKPTVKLETVLSAGDIIKPAERTPDLENNWPAVEACTGQALSDLDDMRRQEGAFLEDDISARLGAIAGHLKNVETASTGLLAHYQQRLEDRIGILTNGIVALDESRIAQEAAVLADRSDISEETVRAASHLEQFHHIMGGAEPAGRKLNFLLQELNREFNTMGAKTEKASVSHTIVEVKTELEKIREQIQNIE